MTESSSPAAPKQETKTNANRQQLIADILLVLLLMIAALIRFHGIDWGDGTFLHPDEGFLTNVETSLIPVQSFSEYWDTANSTINPSNAGHTFFVYGTLPIFLVRYVATWLGQIGWGEVMVVGRQISALADLGVVFLVYLIATRLYDRRVGLLAAAFSTFTVMQIQLSHFFAVDTFLTLFTTLSIYFAIRLATDPVDDNEQPFKPRWFALFGLAFGMALATKVSTFTVAMALPLAAMVRFFKVKRQKRLDAAWLGSAYLILGAIVSVVVFRIFQPYAFSGPGFFGLKLNPEWVSTMREIFNQQSGSLDWPPSIQWARRPAWFSLQNMVLWGMGLPMAVMAWGGFLGAGWQMLKGQWKKHLVIWLWTGAYFVWQSRAFNPTMRYQIQIYPMLAIFAGWAVIRLWDKAGESQKMRKLLRTGAALAAGLSLGLTVFWALAFTNIYSEQVTRIAASSWIYENIPTPFDLEVNTAEGTVNQPIAFSYDYYVSEDLPYLSNFLAHETGTVEKVAYKNVTSLVSEQTIIVQVTENDGLSFPMVDEQLDVSFQTGSQSQTLQINPADFPILAANRDYLLKVGIIPLSSGVVITGGSVRLNNVAGELELPLVSQPVDVGGDADYFEFHIVPVETVSLIEITLELQPQNTETLPEQTFRFTLGTSPDFTEGAVSGEMVVTGLEDGVNTDGGVIELSEPFIMEEGMIYYFQVENLTSGGEATFTGAGVTNEGAWDLGLPLSIDGYSGYNGFYPRDLELNMYDEETENKLDHYLEVLDQTEYLTISSSRQWASTTRIPERYPLNVAYYRNLLGCPDDRTIEWCYNVAEPGMFEGDLGFELIQTFQSDPELFGISINDQFAEEAFTVYDHPKVFIFQKTDDYDPEAVAEILGAVDFDTVIHLTPLEANDFKSLLLSEEEQAQQAESGTWSELFNTDAWFNQSGLGAVLVWYLALSLLGWAVFPLVRRALPGLPDAGFPLVRTAGMLLLAYFSWLAGSLGLTYSRLTIWIVALLLVGLGIWQWVSQRKSLTRILKNRWRYLLLAEMVFLAAFILVLLVRLGNPDLWHPFKGGEKPMDFAYFNAILKSISFPAYDPWYAGGYINYYYFGFVFVGTLVKMIGITPSVAYNLVLPTIFAMLSAGAFSAAWNLYQGWWERRSPNDEGRKKPRIPSWLVGISAALLTGFVGNLGTVKMSLVGMQQLAAQGAYTADAGLLTKLAWTLAGFLQVLQGHSLPYGIADYYWNPSRIIPAPNEVEPITEFPWFTTIYADLHAHYMALALVFLAIAWALSVVLSKAWKNSSRWQIAWSFVFAGIAIGALRATNTWDLPTYLVLGMVAVFYAVMRYADPPEILTRFIPEKFARFVLALAGVGALAAVTLISFQPYAHWYGLPYSSITLWKGTHTPISAYLMHWGLFLFIIVLWMGWETRQWMASTPLSSLRKLEKAQPWLGALAVILILVIAALYLLLDVKIHFIAIPLAVWAAALILRPGISETKRIVLFLVGTALFLTILVEVIVLAGDIARMNTVFKFYLQAWVLFGISSAAALGWTLSELHKWRYRWQTIWWIGLVLLALGALMYPMTATSAKIRDRMSAEAPHTLDGMDYMLTSIYPDEGGVVDLAEEYRAIRWMQENVSGTPVIVEANTGLYRWGSRFSIYTGLPTVIGWDWHQTQQRGFTQTSEISTRLQATNLFYTMEDAGYAAQFLREYNVKYIIVGQLERNYYPSIGLLKFDQLEGDLWTEVYRDGETVIYQVLSSEGE